MEDKMHLKSETAYFMMVQEGETWDRFDGTDYKYNVFEEKEGGSIKVFQLY